MRLLALGGCGGMGRFAVRAALQDPTWSEITVADLDGTAAELFVGSCQAASLHALQLDVTDTRALRAALEQCDVVLNLVGPYFRFGASVLTAAIETGTDYLDINDDWEPTLEMLKLDGRARERGVTAVLGMGASPGLTNLLARRAAQELDHVEVLHTIWGIGEQGLRGDQDDSALSGDGESDGAAIEHWVHQVSGSIVAVEGGALVEMRPLRAVKVDYSGMAPVICRSVGHPEPITFMKSMAGLQYSLNLMDLPRALIAAVSRVARRVDQGELSASEAAAKLDLNVSGGLGLLRSRLGIGLLFEAVMGARHLPELAAYAEGPRGDTRIRVGAGLTRTPPGGMGGITGIPAAIGVGLVGRREVLDLGVLPPERAFAPEAFFELLDPFCVRPAATTEPLVRVRTGEA